MKKELSQNIEIAEGVEVSIEGNTFKVKGPVGENERTFNMNSLTFEKRDNKIVIENKKATKKEKKIMNTNSSHIKSMIRGVQEKFEYKLKICFSHFPISVELKEGEALIKNFLGEKIARKSKIVEGVEVKVDRDIITVSSVDKEMAGQIAANFEAATKIKGKDRRIFQDGIFIISKAGREI